MQKVEYLLAIWSKNPEHYFYINCLIGYLNKKKISTHLIFQKKNKIDNKIKYKCETTQVISTNIKFLNYFSLLYFILYLILFSTIKKPKKIILFNKHPIMAVFFLKLFCKGKIIYHNFDYDPQTNNFFHKILNFIENISSKYFNLIIFSNKKRGQIYKKKARVQNTKILTIFNTLSKNDLKKVKKKSFSKKILFRIGSLGPHHSIINLIKSMKYLNKNYQLLFYGQVVDFSYYLKIKKLIKKDNLKTRIKIKINVSDIQWKKVIRSSNLGLALYEKINLSHKHMMGASQKINAYMASGIPILLPREKQYIEFNKKYRCSILTNTGSPFEIANSIKKVFSSKKEYQKLCDNSISSFKKEFNFETQIKKIKKFL